MIRKAVNSSTIATVGYDPKLTTLEIEFMSGGVYQYSGVSKAVFQEFLDSPSLGHYFLTRIRGNYKFTPIRTRPVKGSERGDDSTKETLIKAVKAEAKKRI